jgi:hypothetical protein
MDDCLFANKPHTGGNPMLHHILVLAVQFGHGLIHLLDSGGGLGGK